MVANIDYVDGQRKEVMEKKFEDPNFVSNQFNIMLDVVADRNKCKKKFGKFKELLKEQRLQMGDLNGIQVY